MSVWEWTCSFYCCFLLCSSAKLPIQALKYCLNLWKVVFILKKSEQQEYLCDGISVSSRLNSSLIISKSFFLQMFDIMHGFPFEIKSLLWKQFVQQQNHKSLETPWIRVSKRTAVWYNVVLNLLQVLLALFLLEMNTKIKRLDWYHCFF